MHRTRPTVSPSCLKMPLVPIQVTCSIVCNKCTHPGSPSTINQPPGFLFTAHQDLPTKIFTIYLASVTQATRTDFGVKSKPIIVVQFLIQFLSVFLKLLQYNHTKKLRGNSNKKRFRMPSYVGDPRPSMLQSLPPWVPRPIGRCRKH